MVSDTGRFEQTDLKQEQNAPAFPAVLLNLPDFGKHRHTRKVDLELDASVKEDFLVCQGDEPPVKIALKWNKYFGQNNETGRNLAVLFETRNAARMLDSEKKELPIHILFPHSHKDDENDLDRQGYLWSIRYMELPEWEEPQPLSDERKKSLIQQINTNRAVIDESLKKIPDKAVAAYTNELIDKLTTVFGDAPTATDAPAKPAAALPASAANETNIVQDICDAFTDCNNPDAEAKLLNYKRWMNAFPPGDDRAKIEKWVLTKLRELPNKTDEITAIITALSPTDNRGLDQRGVTCQITAYHNQIMIYANANKVSRGNRARVHKTDDNPGSYGGLKFVPGSAKRPSEDQGHDSEVVATDISNADRTKIINAVDASYANRNDPATSIRNQNLELLLNYALWGEVYPANSKRALIESYVVDQLQTPGSIDPTGQADAVIEALKTFPGNTEADVDKQLATYYKFAEKSNNNFVSQVLHAFKHRNDISLPREALENIFKVILHYPHWSAAFPPGLKRVEIENYVIEQYKSHVFSENDPRSEAHRDSVVQALKKYPGSNQANVEKQQKCYFDKMQEYAEAQPLNWSWNNSAGYYYLLAGGLVVAGLSLAGIGLVRGKAERAGYNKIRDILKNDTPNAPIRLALEARFPGENATANEKKEFSQHCKNLRDAIKQAFNIKDEPVEVTTRLSSKKVADTNPQADKWIKFLDNQSKVATNEFPGLTLREALNKESAKIGRPNAWINPDAASTSGIHLSNVLPWITFVGGSIGATAAPGNVDAATAPIPVVRTVEGGNSGFSRNTIAPYVAGRGDLLLDLSTSIYPAQLAESAPVNPGKSLAPAELIHNGASIDTHTGAIKTVHDSIALGAASAKLNEKEPALTKETVEREGKTRKALNKESLGFMKHGRDSISRSMGTFSLTVQIGTLAAYVNSLRQQKPEKPYTPPQLPKTD